MQYACHTHRSTDHESHGNLACFQLLSPQNPFPGALLLQGLDHEVPPFVRTAPSLAKTHDADVLHLERVGG